MTILGMNVGFDMDSRGTDLLKTLSRIKGGSRDVEKTGEAQFVELGGWI